MKSQVLVFGLLITTTLMAQKVMARGDTDVGNGGKVIKCFDKQGKLSGIYPLDYMEGIGERNLTITLAGKAKSTWREKIQYVLSNLKQKDEALARELDGYVKGFMNEVVDGDRDLFGKTNDANYRFINKRNFPKCYKMQEAQLFIQKKPEYPLDKRYARNIELWKEIGTLDKEIAQYTYAGMVLHEVLVRKAIDLEHEDTDHTRYLNALISSEEFKSLSQADYRANLKATEFSVNTANSSKLEEMGQYFTQKMPVIYKVYPELKSLVQMSLARRTTDEQDKKLIDLYLGIKKYHDKQLDNVLAYIQYGHEQYGKGINFFINMREILTLHHLEIERIPRLKALAEAFKEATFNKEKHQFTESDERFVMNWHSFFEATKEAFDQSSLFQTVRNGLTINKYSQAVDWTQDNNLGWATLAKSMTIVIGDRKYTFSKGSIIHLDHEGQIESAVLEGQNISIDNQTFYARGHIAFHHNAQLSGFTAGSETEITIGSNTFKIRTGDYIYISKKGDSIKKIKRNGILYASRDIVVNMCGFRIPVRNIMLKFSSTGEFTHGDIGTKVYSFKLGNRSKFKLTDMIICDQQGRILGGALPKFIRKRIAGKKMRINQIYYHPNTNKILAVRRLGDNYASEFYWHYYDEQGNEVKSDYVETVYGVDLDSGTY